MYSSRSRLCILCIALAIGIIYRPVQAVEIHVVGDAAFKYADGEWIQTIQERLGDLTAIWAFAEDDIFVGDDEGYIHHYDGSLWSEVYHDLNSREVLDIWGTSNSNVYVCLGSYGGAESTVMHFNGSIWSEIAMPFQPDLYQSIYGLSEDDIYIVASDDYVSALVYHNSSGDPQSWELVDIPSRFRLEMNCTGVWMSAADDVFVTGSDGKIIHWNGKKWDMPAWSAGHIYDIWGSSSNDVFAVRADEIIHFTGTYWLPMYSLQETQSFGWVTGVSDADVLAGDFPNNVVHYDGEEWRELYCGATATKDAFMFSADYALIVGDDGMMFNFDGSHIRRYDKDYWWTEPLLAVSGFASSNIYAAGKEGFVYKQLGNGWSEMGRPTTKSLNDIIAFHFDDICVLASDEVFQYTGNFWEVIGSGEMGGVEMWGLSGDNLYTVGGGSVYHYDGNDWARVLYEPCVCYDPPYCEEERCYYFYDIWGASDDDIYVVGYRNTATWWGVHHVTYSCPLIYHYDGVEWVRQSLPFYCPIGDPPLSGLKIEAIWGNSPTDIWAGGRLFDYSYSSYILHFDGIDWSEIYAPFYSCSAIWGSSSEDLYFLDGEEGNVYHYNGVDFSSVDLSHAELRDIWGTDITLTATETPEPRFALSQNHPNPFNPSTTIRFSLKSKSNVSLVVYDVAGRLVNVLVDEVRDAGPHDVTWDGRDKNGRGVESGVYFYRLKAGEFIETRKMVLLR